MLFIMKPKINNSIKIIEKIDLIAQLVEQQSVKLWVVGSFPTRIAFSSLKIYGA